MPATLYSPATEGKGVAVLLHGLGGWRDQLLLRRVAESFVEDGYTTFLFDESNGVNSPDNDFFHNTTTQYTHDVEDVFAYLKKQTWYQGPVTLAGHSMGGLVASWYAAKRPEDVSHLILLAPAIAWRSMWWAQLPFALIWLIRGHRMMLGIDGKEFALSPSWWFDFLKFNGYRYATNVTAPTLIISAERDHTVAKPREHRLFTRRFPHATHTTVSWADHDFNGHEDEVIATIRQWRTSL